MESRGEELFIYYTENLAVKKVDTLQRHGKNFKEVPPNFMKDFNVDDVTLTSQLKASHRKINIKGEKMINYRVTSLSNPCC